MLDPDPRKWPIYRGGHSPPYVPPPVLAASLLSAGFLGAGTKPAEAGLPAGLPAVPSAQEPAFKLAYSLPGRELAMKYVFLLHKRREETHLPSRAGIKPGASSEQETLMARPPKMIFYRATAVDFLA